MTVHNGLERYEIAFDSWKSEPIQNKVRLIFVDFFAFFIFYEKYNCILMHIYSINGIPNLKYNKLNTRFWEYEIHF